MFKGFDSMFGKRKNAPPSPTDTEGHYKAADPTTYSALPPTEELTQVGMANSARADFFGYGPVYPVLETASKERYTSLEGKGGVALAEQVVARILKGIVNVSDIVSTQDGVVLSKNMPLEHIEHKTSRDEVAADLAILAHVFGDSDHNLRNGRNIYSANGKHAYYDFAYAHELLLHFSDSETGMNPAPSDGKPISRSVAALIRQKSEALYARLEGPEGLAFLNAIFAATKRKPSELFERQKYSTDSGAEVTAERIRDLLLKRLAILKELGISH